MAERVEDNAPEQLELTAYDQAHLKTYLRLIDADGALAPWEDVARHVLGFDPAVDGQRAKRSYDSHLARAKWISDNGYLDLLRSGKT